MSSDRPIRLRIRRARPHSACLGLGSNSDPERNLADALQALAQTLAIYAVSIAWQSPAVGVGFGFAGIADYVNAALLVRTGLSRDELIGLLKRTEEALGRAHEPDNALCVPIDIDLLVFDGVVWDADLWNLAYRAVPMAELLPDLARPGSGEPLAAAAVRLAAETPIRPRPDILRVANRLQTAEPGATGFTRLTIS
jgi:2-amino-4-hydroxy-6-hydroxymethyldihydropteridine diphosphokinase